MLCPKGLNKSLNRSTVTDNSTPHPPGPLSPKRGEGEKIAWFSFDFKGIRILDCIEIWVMTRVASPGLSSVNREEIVPPLCGGFVTLQSGIGFQPVTAKVQCLVLSAWCLVLGSLVRGARCCPCALLFLGGPPNGVFVARKAVKILRSGYIA